MPGSHLPATTSLPMTRLERVFFVALPRYGFAERCDTLAPN